jgi:hypothetical protein
MIAEAFAVNGVEVTANVAVEAPAATVTPAGTMAAGSELLIVTVWPPEGAGPVRVKVPLSGLPPVTLAAREIA